MHIERLAPIIADGQGTAHGGRMMKNDPDLELKRQVIREAKRATVAIWLIILVCIAVMALALFNLSTLTVH